MADKLTPEVIELLARLDYDDDALHEVDAPTLFAVLALTRRGRHLAARVVTELNRRGHKFTDIGAAFGATESTASRWAKTQEPDVIPVHMPVIAIEGEPTVDGRLIEHGALLADSEAGYPILARDGDKAPELVGRLTYITCADTAPGKRVWSAAGLVEVDGPAARFIAGEAVAYAEVSLSHVETIGTVDDGIRLTAGRIRSVVLGEDPAFLGAEVKFGEEK